ncbi:AraC family transcriptional regulator, regulatory protein of adaptative response / methylated-DNA-[protein]-cysteine methyltransferase [Luteibacter sp. UNCMF331Sha3.1]|uniref:bifunctional transcriptional activator/DNA repair enzyme AdaA n=1 Tax=Luteibacter sp. UNCMF331Sha3.1 TaxID=1502760 RepID=UPI0008D16254|nr:trifunctional transcriptional activator/DNA repair protein Ada/methylated-DNA--[protein]-cysteine S-methyltransferase [Luteibacter sp. UNCMF331Sha3.1]SEM50529.1 AraC family transcriptional regulator, regulatory protein of adaptative response / methylated-DNA-[protein]-cysteine methyltransferase [Luteibacter sp. UNCMF331Sha3.1]
MLFDLPDHETLYRALLERDPSYDGHVFVGVTSTGVFCRLTCPARKPLMENTRFFDSVAACFEAGFRPCLRCRPLDPVGEREPMVSALLRHLENEPERVWSEEDLVRLGYDPSTVRRGFKRHLGLTFLDMARLRRAGRGMDRLVAGASVVDSQQAAGYASGSGFRDAIVRLLGDCPADLRGRELLKADWIETPIGSMLAVADAHALHLLEFFDRTALPRELKRLRLATRSTITFGRTSVIDRIEAELRDYFAGTRHVFETPLGLHGSVFTRRVWDELMAIAPGTTRSYAQIAASAGRHTAVRAVARANGANQLAIVIPCHRVIGADGSLTGYGGGLWRKDWLLRHERKFA